MTWETYYSSLLRLPDWLRQPVPFIVDALPLFKEQEVQSILDLGCGVGRNLIWLGKEGFAVVGVDTSRSALKMAKAWSKAEAIPRVTVLRASMVQLPFIRRAFHAVVSVSVIHHALEKDIQETMREIRRLLRDDGLLLANLLSTEDDRYGSGEKLESATFRVQEEFEDRRFCEVHHFFSQEETRALLREFKQTQIEPLQSGTDKPHRYWKVVAAK